MHAGTFFGDFLPALSRDAPKSRIWAFEPNPENFKCAFVTAYLNGLSNVELHNAALGETRGYLPLLITDLSGRSLGGGSRIADDDVYYGSKALTVLVKTVSIDDIVPPDRCVSIIQLDVEGYEKFALTGAIRTIRRWRPTLVLEILPDESWLSEQLYPLGYRIEGNLHENTVLKVHH